MSTRMQNALAAILVIFIAVLTLGLDWNGLLMSDVEPKPLSFCHHQCERVSL